ncbi:hypothetical protein LX16_0633 [Stackebrandtia albiflava]|uniref:DUF1365 family protein n=1 Tax=Stackebrandtia albiflava TaxID=406432 RepID=A0A562VAM8_9ACTN|nr:DUF1365 domain-containing protein [Stackebrandtia albiflava]TWJ14939.1 hypothetical protein LX16_0633 [Stackebrandtia albiflava]
MVTTAGLYRTEVRHTRFGPVPYRLRHRGYLWLIDTAAPPRLPWPLRRLARFPSSDHVGDPGASLRDNAVARCAAAGIDIGDGRVWMLANARAWGHVFNPLTVYWCHDESDRLRCVIAEVHNTYGDRHVYLLRPDARGHATTDKRFHVSPFFTVSGRYRLLLPEPGERLGLAVTLLRDGAPALTATVTGRRFAVTPRRLFTMAVRFPLETWRVSAAIRFHGVRLYLRGLPVTPRPSPPSPQEGSQ